MLFLVLAGCRLVTVQTVHALLGVLAHFVFVDYRISRAGVALGTLCRCSDKGAVQLLGLNFRPGTVDYERRHNEAIGPSIVPATQSAEVLDLLTLFPRMDGTLS